MSGGERSSGLGAAGAGGTGAPPTVDEMVSAVRLLEEELRNRIATGEAAAGSRAAAVRAIDSVKQIADSASAGGEDPPETMLAVGGGVFVQTRIPTPDRMLLDIGYGVVVEKKSSDVLDYLENRIREIDIVIKNTEASKSALVSYIEQYRDQINHAMQSMQGS